MDTHDAAVSVEATLSSALQPYLIPDLVALVQSHLMRPSLMVIGGIQNVHGNDNHTADVWRDGQWLHLDQLHYTGPEYPFGTGLMAETGDWTWQADCANPPFSAIALRVDEVGQWFVIKQRYQCSEDSGRVVIEAVAHHAFSPTDGTITLLNIDSHLRGVAETDDGTIYLVAQYDQLPMKTCAQGFWAYRPEQSRWQMLAQPDREVSLESAVSVGNDLYLFNEQGGSDWYRASDGTWHALPRSRVDRSYIQAAFDASRNHIYLVGGNRCNDPDQDARSCERLSLVDRAWRDMPLMKKGRWGASLAVFNDQLYAIGGRSKLEDRSFSRDDAEYLCLTARREWVLMPAMTLPREDALVLVCNTFS